MFSPHGLQLFIHTKQSFVLVQIRANCQFNQIPFGKIQNLGTFTDCYVPKEYTWKFHNIMREYDDTDYQTIFAETSILAAFNNPETENVLEVSGRSSMCEICIVKQK